MKASFVLTATVAAMFTLSAQADMHASKMKAFEKECRGYALEEEIPQEEMQGYIAQCVQDLLASDAESDEQMEEAAPEE
jgi:hypothetical protein